jgi:uncharacterized membrane protein
MSEVAVIMIAILSIALIFVYWKLNNNPGERFTVTVAEVFTGCTIGLWAFLGGIGIKYILLLVSLLISAKYLIKPTIKQHGQ